MIRRIKAGVNKTNEVISAIDDIKVSVKTIKDMVEQIYHATEDESKKSNNYGYNRFFCFDEAVKMSNR